MLAVAHILQAGNHEHWITLFDGVQACVSTEDCERIFREDLLPLARERGWLDSDRPVVEGFETVRRAEAKDA